MMSTQRTRRNVSQKQASAEPRKTHTPLANLTNLTKIVRSTTQKAQKKEEQVEKIQIKRHEPPPVVDMSEFTDEEKEAIKLFRTATVAYVVTQFSDEDE